MTVTASETSAAEAPFDETPRGRRNARRRRAGLIRLGVTATQVGVLVVLIAGWQLAADQRWVNPLLLPPPQAVLDSLLTGLIGGTWHVHIVITLAETAQGFVIGALAAVVVGGMFAFVPFVNTVLYPYIIGLTSFPKIAIVPLLIVALGYGSGPKIAVAALLAFFPVMTAVVAGLTDINPDEHNLMRSMGANRWQEFTRLRLPNAMSYIIPSLDVALVFALLGAVAAEIIGSKAGMGYVLTERQAFGDIPTIFAALIVLALMGVFLHVLTTVVSRLLPRKIFPR